MFLEVVAILGLLLSATGSPIDGRIVNGTDAQPGEFPFIVSFRARDRHSCGASILNERSVLTAAHCVQNDASIYSVQYGLTRIIPGEDAPNVIKVSRVIPHENYVAGNGYLNDVALVELEEPLPWGPNVQPVKLPTAFDATPENAHAVLIGWGYPYTGGSVLEDLQKVNILVYPDVVCEIIHAATGPTRRDYHICAGVSEGGKGQCSGDSGGPLLVNGVEVGIVSWSVKPCTVQGYPGVFTKVSSHLPWISRKLSSS